jgi:S1-C subfamily serine protease
MRSPPTETSDLRSFLAVALIASAVARAGSTTETSAGGIPLERLRRAVVAVRVSGQAPNWKTPWKKMAPHQVEFSGVVADGHTLLVSAAHLAGYTFIEVQRPGDQDWVPARAKLVDHDVALAVLEVDDAGFWKDLVPLPLAPEVPTRGEVQLASWKSGRFEVETATISRVDVESFGSGRVRILALHLATSATGSTVGEAVVVGGQLVGMVGKTSKDQFSAVTSTFLREFRRETGSTPYHGFARLFVHWQDLTNPALRELLHLRPEDGGVLVRRVMPQGGAAGVLKPRDVMLEIAGRSINSKGRIEHPRYGPVSWLAALTDGKRAGDTVDVLVLRDQKRQHLPVQLRRWNAQDDRIPFQMADQKPDFVIAGGLVFQALSAPYLRTLPGWQASWASPLTVEYELNGEFPTADHPRTIVLTQVIPDPANLGYQELHDLIVDQVNGVHLRTLDDLRAALLKPTGNFQIIEFAAGQGPRRIALDAMEVAAAETRIRLD